MLPLKPLLAIDWIEILIFLFIVSSSLIGQLFKAAQQRQKKAKARPKPAVPPAPGGPPPGKPAAGPVARPKTALEKEIEAFLGKHLGGQKQRAAPPKPRPPQQPAQRPPRRPPAAQRRPAPKPRPPAEPSFPATESVEQHVQRHIRSGGVSGRDAHLGEDLQLADERMESHLQEVFDHRLGNLRDEMTRREPSVAQGTDASVWDGRDLASSPLTAELRSMLSSPQQLQAAIVLSEILRRPEELWSQDD